MKSNKQIDRDNYLIEVNKSDPQKLDSKKSFFLLNIQNKGIPISPRRDCMPTISSNNFINNNINLNNNFNSTTLSFHIPIKKPTEEKKIH